MKIRQRIIRVLAISLLILIFGYTSYGNNLTLMGDYEPGNTGWSLDATGTKFQITNSHHLNVILTSSEIVSLSLESVPEVISLRIKHNSSVASTFLTMSGFEANKKYYRYQDGNLEEIFIADEDGCHFFVQDISTNHHIFILERKSTIYIKSDGSIEPSTAPVIQDGDTYKMTADVYESIYIQKSDIILDGQGHRIINPGTYGIYLSNVSNVLVQNFIVAGSYGIMLSESIANIITDNLVSNCTYGIYISGLSYDNDIHHNEVTNCGYAGIYLKGSDRNQGNIARQNTLTDNFIGVYSGFGSWYNTIDENKASNGYLGLMMWTTFRNNVTNNKFENFGEGIAMNWGLWGSFEGNLIENCITGFGIYQSKYNTFTENILKNIDVVMDMSEGSGILITDWNVFHHNDFISDSMVIYPIFRNNVWDNDTGEGNFWSDYSGFDDGSGVGRFGEPRFVDDGVGDTDIPHQNVDWYPSMLPWISNEEPIADPNGPNIVAVGDIVYLDGSDSYDPEGDILGFVWYFNTIPFDSLAYLFDDDTAEPFFFADVEGQYIVNLIVSDGILNSEPNTVTITAIPPDAAAEEMLIDVNEIITGLPTESFTNDNSANALSNKIEATLAMIELGMYEDALDKLQNDILKKTDGCATEGSPDNNDWIITCEDQAIVYPLVLRTIELLERLIE